MRTSSSRFYGYRNFSSVDYAVHVSLLNILKDYILLEDDETAYARDPLTYVDFLLFRRMDKSPLLAIEVDGTTYHSPDNVQAERDQKKVAFLKNAEFHF